MARKRKNRKNYVTQQEFADYWGITQPRVSQLLANGTIPHGGTKKDWDSAYAKHLRSIAAHHVSEEGIDAVKEGALLKRAQRQEIQIKLDKEQRNLLSSEEVAAVINNALGTAKTKWIAYHPGCARSCRT